MIHWAYLAIAIAAEVLGTSFLRAAAGFTRPLPTLIVLTAYVVAFYFLSLTLDQIPTGIAYAVWSGVGVTLVAMIGWAFYGQKLDAAAFVGIGLIVAGVIVLNLFSTSAAH
jgi:small multidrug resistance pump